MTQIHYHGIPKQLLTDLKKVIAKYKEIIPSWCHEIHFYWDSSEDEDFKDAAAISLYRPEYRMANVYLKPGIVGDNFEVFETTVCHELVHLFYGEMHSYIINLLDSLNIDLHLKKHVIEQIRTINEGSVTDMTRALIIMRNK